MKNGLVRKQFTFLSKLCTSNMFFKTYGVSFLNVMVIINVYIHVRAEPNLIFYQTFFCLIHTPFTEPHTAQE